MMDIIRPCPDYVKRYHINEEIEGLYCKESYDYAYCWPNTAANETMRLQCRKDFPSSYASRINTSAYAHWYCNQNGTWDGYAYYDDCLIIGEGSDPNCNYSNPEDSARMEFQLDVITKSKTLELVGVSLSWIVVALAIIIFYTFRSLRCHRTKIHQHLFFAFIVRLTFDLIIMIDKKARVERNGEPLAGIAANNIVCKTLELCREYTKLCTFAWMFVEGLYLNSLLSSAVFRKPPFFVFYLIGWASSIPFVFAFLTAMQVSPEKDIMCWGTYTESNWYLFLIEFPRNGFLLVNVILLLNILRVLVMKLQESNTSETRQVRKAIKATVVLLPLLGIANLVWLFELPSICAQTYQVVLYCYIALGLDSFQGFFLALLYCFLNVEVRATLKRKWRAWRNARNPYRAHATVVTTTTDILSSCDTNEASIWRQKTSEF